MNNGVIYLLLAVSIISIVISVVSMVLILNVLRKQKVLLDFVRQDLWKARPSQPDSNKDNMVQGSNQNARKYGVIICKKCYASIPENSVVCPVCKTSVGRR